MSYFGLLDMWGWGSIVPIWPLSLLVSTRSLLWSLWSLVMVIRSSWGLPALVAVLSGFSRLLGSAGFPLFAWFCRVSALLVGCRRLFCLLLVLVLFVGVGSFWGDGLLASSVYDT